MHYRTTAIFCASLSLVAASQVAPAVGRRGDDSVDPSTHGVVAEGSHDPPSGPSPSGYPPSMTEHGQPYSPPYQVAAHDGEPLIEVPTHGGDEASEPHYHGDTEKTRRLNERDEPRRGSAGGHGRRISTRDQPLRGDDADHLPHGENFDGLGGRVGSDHFPQEDNGDQPASSMGSDHLLQEDGFVEPDSDIDGGDHSHIGAKSPGELEKHMRRPCRD